MRKIKEVDLDELVSSLECPSDQLERLKLATPEVLNSYVCIQIYRQAFGVYVYVH